MNLQLLFTFLPTHALWRSCAERRRRRRHGGDGDGAPSLRPPATSARGADEAADGGPSGGRRAEVDGARHNIEALLLDSAVARLCLATCAVAVGALSVFPHQGKVAHLL